MPPTRRLAPLSSSALAGWLAMLSNSLDSSARVAPVTSLRTSTVATVLPPTRLALKRDHGLYE
jgi:hypothetical protein